MTWTGYAAVFGLFFLTHSIPVRPTVKARITGVIGKRGFGIGYSMASVAMLGLLIWAAQEAPFLQLWPQAGWQRPVVHMGMLLVCLIVAFSIARPNPFSFGGARKGRFDPKHAGVVRFTRHPILAALAIWAGLHLLPNGDLAHVLLFGVLGGFAVMGRVPINRRKRRELGDAAWHALDREVANAPWFQTPANWGSFFARLLFGVLAFVALLLLHPHVIGVSAI
ncbi:MAG: NnrU family protein [Pseudomonadota bacterium]